MIDLVRLLAPAEGTAIDPAARSENRHGNRLRLHQMAFAPFVSRRWFVLAWIIATSGIAGWATKTYPMEFSTADRFGDTVIVGSGEIVSGDQRRLEAIAGKADVLAHGYRILELDSPGGNVGAALALSEVVHDKQFHTVITSGSECASACGAVLFIAGHLRTVENGGRLGMHTCYGGQTRIPEEQCNNKVGEHAFSKGIAHGAVYAYMSAVPPEDMLWFDREHAECAGLTRYFMESRDDFSAIGPCFQRSLYGKDPDPVMKWRIKRKRGGFSAFVRSHSDYEEVAQTEIYCSERKPGVIHVAATFLGGDDSHADKFQRMVVELDDKAFSTSHPLVSHDGAHTTYTYELPPSEVLNFLKRYHAIVISLKFEFDPNPFSFGARLAEGREALVFAANGCVP